MNACLTISLLLIIFGKDILLLFGHQFVVGYPVLVVLVIANAIALFCNMATILVSYTDNQEILIPINFVTFLIMLLMCVILIPGIHIMGAAITEAVSCVLMPLTVVYFAKKRLGLKPLTVI